MSRKQALVLEAAVGRFTRRKGYSIAGRSGIIVGRREFYPQRVARRMVVAYAAAGGEVSVGIKDFIERLVKEQQRLIDGGEIPETLLPLTEGMHPTEILIFLVGMEMQNNLSPRISIPKLGLQ